MVTCSPDTLRDPLCGSSGRCSNSRNAEVRGLSPRAVWRPALRCLLHSRLLRIQRSGNYRIINPTSPRIDLVTVVSGVIRGRWLMFRYEDARE
jgi:hypothetical protein